MATGARHKAIPGNVIVVVLAAALLHATWNAMAKGRQGSDPLITATVIAAGAGVVCIAMLCVLGAPAWESMPYVVASGIVHVAYLLLLGLSYRLAEYSAIYPLMRGTAPLLTTAASFIFVGETIGAGPLFGIVLLSTGVLGLGFHSILRGGLNKAGLAVAMANIAVIVAYTLIDGIGARLSGNPGGYVALMMLLTGVLHVSGMLYWRPRAVTDGISQQWMMGLLGGAMVMTSYGVVLWAMTKAPIGAVAALRETSVLFGAAIATLIMGERFSLARVLATVAIFGGLACLRLT
ncbi:MAG: EamA family transporter [Hyphomicrobiaceae bacterium]